MKKIIIGLLGSLILYSVNQIGKAFSSPIQEIKEEKQIVEQVNIGEDEIVEEKSDSTDENNNNSTKSSVSSETEKINENIKSSNKVTTSSTFSESKKINTESDPEIQSEYTQDLTSTSPQTAIEQQPTQNNYNSATDYYYYKTGGKWDYNTEAECYANGDKVEKLELDDILDYNEQYYENQIQPNIRNTECYPVNTDSGTKYFLQINCYSGECNSVYKSKYLGK